MLSHRSVGGVGRQTRSSVRRFMIHLSSEVAMATARYLASLEDLATVRCFLENQDIGLLPKKMMNVKVEVLS